MESILLGSLSPRRAELLSQMGIPFRVLDSALDEAGFLPSPEASDPVGELAMLLAGAKLKAIRKLGPIPERLVLCADTLVEADGHALGKARNSAAARRMMERLAGRTHRVLTALALADSRSSELILRLCESEVTFSAIASDEMDAYLASRDWEGVAGAYRIQGYAARFVESIRGSYSNIVGLPIRTLYVMLRESDYDFAKS